MKNKQKLLCIGILWATLCFSVILQALFFTKPPTDRMEEDGAVNFITGTVIDRNPLTIYTDDLPGKKVFTVQTSDRVKSMDFSVGEKIQVYYGGSGTSFGPPSIEGVTEIKLVGKAGDDELSEMLDYYQGYFS